MNDDQVPSVRPDGKTRDGAGVRSMLMATSLLGTAIGLQAMISLYYLPFRGDPSIPPTLMSAGKALFLPERDTKIYVLGTAATLLLIVLLGWHQKWRLRGFAPDRVDAEATQVAATFNILAVLSLLAYLLILALVTICRSEIGHGSQNPLILRLSGYARSTQLLFFLPSILAMMLAVLGTRPSIAGRVAGLWERWPGEDPAGPPGAVRWKYSGCFWALGIALGVVLLFLNAEPWATAGVNFIQDGLPFHHWDYYVMGPALGYRDGRALGVDVYTQYGLGYPMIVNWLSPLVRLSYGNLYLLASIYGCLYFLGLAVLFRLRHGSWAWAAVGVLVAARLQAFEGIGDETTMWTFPSSSILRYSMDVWFFMALWMHLNTGRLAWAAAIGLTAGLALLMGFDTGIYLLVILGFYLGIRLLFGPRGGLEGGVGFLGELRSAALASTIALAVIVIGIATATRRAPWELDRQALGRLFESLLAYSGGLSALPMSDTPGYLGQCQFMVVAGTYLACIGSLVLSLLASGADRRQVFRGCLSAYGLGTLMLFVQRSHPYNIYHGIIPFVILAVDAIHAVVHRLASPGWRVGWTALLGAGALALLLADSDVRHYPGVIQTALMGTPAPAIEFPSLGVRIRPISPELLRFAEDFEAVTTRVAEDRKAGLKVAILDEAETMFELASGAPAMDRYNPLIPNLLFRKELDEAKERFVAGRFDLVVIRSDAEPESYIYKVEPAWLADIRGEFRQLLHRDYSPLSNIGRFQIWALHRTPKVSP
jgi:hypothetical protein